MNKSKGILLILALSLLVGITGLAIVNKVFTNRNTSITISENKNELHISAAFPQQKSKQVQDFLRAKLNLVDLQDLSYLKIEDYTTPDNQMNFYINSRPGYIELTMNKERNDRDAYVKMKKTGEEIKSVLTN